MFFFTRMLTDR